MTKTIALNQITREQVEQCTEKLYVKVSNIRKQEFYQTIINSKNIIKWFADEEFVYYYRIGGVLQCIGTVKNYDEYLDLIVNYFNKNISNKQCNRQHL